MSQAGAMGRVEGILLGVGNSLRCDDGIGNWVARHFAKPGWLALDCGTAPENFTGVVRREMPRVLVIVDAADLGEEPGTLRIVPKSRIIDTGIGTHMLPLHHLFDYLAPSVDEIVLMGIQPWQVAAGTDLSAPVLRAAEQLVAILQDGDWCHVKTLPES